MRARSDVRAMLISGAASREKVAAGLRCLILTTVFVMARMDGNGRSASFDLVMSIGAAYVLATTFLPWARFEMRRITLAMLAVDVALITGLIYTHSGIRSEYYLLYYLPILHASVRLSFRDAVGTCILSAMSYLLVGILERPDTSISTTVISRVVTFAASAGLLAAFFVVLAREHGAHQRLTKHYQEAMEAKTEFLSRVSHEFRTPLTAIVGFSQLLYEQEQKVDAEREQEYLTVIREQAQHLARMIEDMLDITRIDDGQFTLRQQVSSLPEMIESAVSGLDKPTDRERVGVSVEPATPSAWADRNEMEQAISRILYNALEHSGEERVSVRVRPEGEDREEILVSISARGMELREEEMLPLFGPAAAMVTETPSSGGCLGLAVARALIEMHGGRVWVDDGDGAGAAINFTVPAATHRRERSLPEVIVGLGGPSEERAEADGEGNGIDSRRRPVGSQADARQPDPIRG